MGWDGAGSYTRQHNFSADASAGIKILAARMDAELDDVASAMTIAWARNGQNTPTQAIPMGGQRFINVGAATSVGNYMRVREFIENIPVFMQDVETSADRISVSAQYFTSVSANQAPGDGTRIFVRANSNKSSAVLYLNGHSANVHYSEGGRIASAITSGGLYEFLYSSADTAWKVSNPDAIDSRFKYVRTAAELSAGVTPTSYQYEPGDVRRYGAALDGSTDDTTALQRWVSVGGRLTFPVASTAKVTSAITLVSDTVIDAVEGATIRQYTANANVMSATSKSNIRVRGLTLQAVGSFSTYFNGCGFNAESCTEVHVEGCKVTGHRGWGVMFYNSDDCSAVGNRFVSSPVTNADTHDETAGDIAIAGDSSRCIARGNWCLSGNGIGINVIPLLSTDVANDNTVEGNVIQNCKLYGVSAYQNDPSATLARCAITDNTIDTVTGDVAHTIQGYVYGAGIYCVGAVGLTITDNRIRNTHSGAVTFVDLLAPGAIGLTNCGKAGISDNEIDTCGMYGITVRDPDAIAPANQKTKISDNNISNVDKSGIQVQEKANVSVIENEIYTTGEHGVLISNTTTKRAAVRVNGNVIKAAGASGIIAGYLKQGSISGNVIESPVVHGIVIDHADTIDLSGNTIFGHDVYGIFVDTNVTNFTCDHNVIDGNSTGNYGIYFDGKGNLSQSNKVSNSTLADFAGTYNPRPSSTPAAGTWVAGDTIYYIAPAAGANIGAICTAGGTPGTWKTFGAIAP